MIAASNYSNFNNEKGCHQNDIPGNIANCDKSGNLWNQMLEEVTNSFRLPLAYTYTKMHAHTLFMYTHTHIFIRTQNKDIINLIFRGIMKGFQYEDCNILDK